MVASHVELCQCLTDKLQAQLCWHVNLFHAMSSTCIYAICVLVGLWISQEWLTHMTSYDISSAAPDQHSWEYNESCALIRHRWSCVKEWMLSRGWHDLKLISSTPQHMCEEERLESHVFLCNRKWNWFSIGIGMSTQKWQLDLNNFHLKSKNSYTQMHFPVCWKWFYISTGCVFP